MAVENKSNNNLYVQFGVVPYNDLPIDVLKTTVDTIILDHTFPVASQDTYHVTKRNFELVLQGRTFFVSEQTAKEQSNEDSEGPVKVHFPSKTYKIIIQGKNLKYVSNGTLKVFRGNFDLVVRQDTIYLTTN